MKIYLAGNLDDGRAACRDHAAFAQERWDAAVERGAVPVRRLVSFAYSQYTPAHEAIKGDFGPAVEYGLDSGAFSAWSRGIRIDLEKYAEHILAHRDLYGTFIASLDVIPGRKVHGLNNVTAAERERAAEEGWDNWIELKRLLKPAGITPIHTYHRGEDIKWLKRLMDESWYLSLGGTSILPTEEKIKWLDSIMPYLTDDKGWSIRKLHGFACTSVRIMKRYPWASVDSASWHHASEHGQVYIRFPGGTNTTISFYREDWKPTLPSNHFFRCGESDRRVIAAYLASRGFTPEEMHDAHCESCGTDISDRNRDAVNVDFFWDLEDEITRDPRPWRRPAGVFRLR